MFNESQKRSISGGWRTLFLLLLFVFTCLILMPLKMSNAGTLSKTERQASPLSPLPPLSPIVSPLAKSDSTGEIVVKEVEVEDTEKEESEGEPAATTKSAARSVQGQTAQEPIIIGTEANQISFVLLGAVLVGLIVVVGLVLGRRN